MTKNEFKQGDKVVAKQYYDIDINGYSTTIPIGEEGVIEDIYSDELLVSFSNYGLSLIRPVSEFEPIMPLDRRTAFLTRLQSLLREFGAEICALQTGEEEVALSLTIGTDEAEYGGKNNQESITADNIMDFNKE